MSSTRKSPYFTLYFIRENYNFHSRETLEYIPVHFFVGLISFVDGISIYNIPVTISKYPSKIIGTYENKGESPRRQSESNIVLMFKGVM